MVATAGPSAVRSRAIPRVAAPRIRRTTTARTARSASICTMATMRAGSVLGVMSPKPTVEKTVTVKRPGAPALPHRRDKTTPIRRPSGPSLGAHPATRSAAGVRHCEERLTGDDCGRSGTATPLPRISGAGWRRRWVGGHRAPQERRARREAPRRCVCGRRKGSTLGRGGSTGRR